MGDIKKDRSGLLLVAENPGYTPGAKDLPGLIAVLSGENGKNAKLAQRALLKAQDPRLLSWVHAALLRAKRPARGRLTELYGRLVEKSRQPREVEVLLELLRDADLKTQINAISALGRLNLPAVGENLQGLLAENPRREVSRAIAKALGRTGGADAYAVLKDFAHGSEDADIVARARLMARRETARLEPSSVIGDKSLPAGSVLWLHTRAGLEELLIQEAQLRGWTAKKMQSGFVELKWSQSFGEVFALRLFSHVSLAVGEIEVADSDPPVQAVIQAVLGASSLLGEFTVGPVRYRWHWPELPSAQIWDLAKELTECCPELINDPRDSVWQIVVARTNRKSLRVAFLPKRLLDPRFQYRRGYVYAASHPTLAAALARVAGIRADDVVWDPFCGSGTELIERAWLGPFDRLLGSDLDPAALSVARTNLAAAGVEASLTLGNAATLEVPAPTLILCNPPMGRRVQRGTLLPLLDTFVPHAARILRPGGRLVWLTPLPERTTPACKNCGLILVSRQTVDMGGFPAELQHWRKENKP